MIKKRNRRGVSPKLRFEVFKRDDFTCQYCGRHPPDVLLHADHIISVNDGGADDIDNLITACEPCNLGKGATPLSSVPLSLSERAADLTEREQQIAGYCAAIENQRDRVERELWRVVETLQGGPSGEYPKDRCLQIKRLIGQLGFYPTLEAAEIADAKIAGSGDPWRYFLGVVRNKLKAKTIQHGATASELY